MARRKRGREGLFAQVCLEDAVGKELNWQDSSNVSNRSRYDSHRTGFSHSEQQVHPCQIANRFGRAHEGQSDNMAHSAPYEKTVFPNVRLPCMDRQGVFK